jgi:cyclic dehypoxanthinyl futalosine synthase
MNSPQARLAPDTALAWLREMPLVELMMRADEARWQWHPKPEVTFVLDTNPNYTNVCTASCTFCSFYRHPGEEGSYTLSAAQVAQKIAAARARGATTVLLQGGHNPELPLSYYLDMIRTIRETVPDIHLHLFSPSEIAQIAAVAAESVESVLRRCWDLGVRTMPGGGAEILVDRVRRRISPKKLSASGWLEVMRVAHRIGMKTTATMMYGHLEEDREIITHLERLRDLQDETGGFLAFIPWSFKRGESPLSRLVAVEATPSYYLRVLAISRLMLDNVPHIQSSWFGEGWRAGQLGLHAGADDFGGMLIEENVLYEANHKFAITLPSLLLTIREAGFIPVQRSTLYEPIQRLEGEENIPTGDMEPPLIERHPPGRDFLQQAGITVSVERR